MQLKRPLFVRGRRIEQIGKLSEQPFLTRPPRVGPQTGSAAPVAPARRALLPRLAGALKLN